LRQIVKGAFDETQARVLDHRQSGAGVGRVIEREIHRAARGGEIAGGKGDVRAGTEGRRQHPGNRRREIHIKDGGIRIIAGEMEHRISGE